MLGLILPVAGTLLLLLANKKKAAPPQAPLPTPTVEDLREGVAKKPAGAGKVKKPLSKANPAVEVGNGTLGDVFWGAVRNPAKQTPTQPTKTPPVVTTKPGQTLGDIFWGPVRQK